MGVKIYSKEEITDRYPNLSEMLFRTGKEFVKKCKIHMKNMKTFNQYKNKNNMNKPKIIPTHNGLERLKIYSIYV